VYYYHEISILEFFETKKVSLDKMPPKVVCESKELKECLDRNKGISWFKKAIDKSV
jgi:hypothetical protein